MIIFLDTGVLGVLASPNDKQEVRDCQQWLYSLTIRGTYCVSSDICDYELRRSLILESFKYDNEKSIKKLDELQSLIDFFPVTSQVLNHAAYLWANSRRQRQLTADHKTFDADVIIAAQCQFLTQDYPGQSLVCATTNVNHLSRFIDAQTWQGIRF
jgi:predicted nucleic acid-binding protein